MTKITTATDGYKLKRAVRVSSARQTNAHVAQKKVCDECGLPTKCRISSIKPVSFYYRSDLDESIQSADTSRNKRVFMTERRLEFCNSETCTSGKSGIAEQSVKGLTVALGSAPSKSQFRKFMRYGKLPAAVSAE